MANPPDAPEVQIACPECDGVGVRMYPSTARGKGGQGYTVRTCEKCKGTGWVAKTSGGDRWLTR